MTTLTESKKVGDLLIQEFSQMYNREDGYVKNPSGSAIADQSLLGYPVMTEYGYVTGGDGYALCAAGDEATADGILLTNEIVDLAAGANTAAKKPILVRGPAVINKSQLPTKDYADADFTSATLVARLLALGIVVREEPTIIDTQSA